MTEGRRFGFALGTSLGILGALALWRHRPAGPYLAGASLALLVLAAVAPRALEPPARAAARVLRALNWVLMRLVLAVTFLLVITPLALVMRLAGRDVLGRSFDPGRPSYWVPKPPPEGGAARYEKQY